MLLLEYLSGEACEEVHVGDLEVNLVNLIWYQRMGLGSVIAKTILHCPTKSPTANRTTYNDAAAD